MHDTNAYPLDVYKRQGFMAATVSADTSVGAGRPGMRAVVTTMSACLQRSDTSAACRAIQAGGMGRA